MDTPRNTGNVFEQMAVNYLEKQGLRLITQNFNTRFGEIDSIFLDATCLVFVEVRYRKNLSHGPAIESINFQKQQKIKKAAAYFFLKNKRYQTVPCRFDVITIDGDKLSWIKHAFY